MRLPRGCRFVPNELELIQYLFDKVEGRADPGQGLIMDDVDVYGSSPHMLSADSIANGGDGKLFYFTPIKFRKASSPCRDRSTPYGYWKATNRRSEIHDHEGKEVGFMQNFIYFHGKNGGARTKWMMKEYTLSANDSPNVALCVIHSTLNQFHKPNQERNSYRKPIQNQSPSSQNTFQGSPWPYGISNPCSGDGGACSGSASIVDTSHGMNGLSWEPGSGLLESLLFNNEDSLLATPPPGSGLSESFNDVESLFATELPGSGLLESFLTQ